MDSLYGINVKNKFDLFCDEDVDPLEILAQVENAKKIDADKKKDDKGKKIKPTKKQVLKTDNKNKPVEEIKPVKEGKSLNVITFAFKQFNSITSRINCTCSTALQSQQWCCSYGNHIS